MSIQQIDDALARYYKHKSAEYYDDDNHGKFVLFCEENGFETDDVIEELQQDVQDCCLVEFDEEFPTSITITNDKISEIYNVLAECLNKHDAFLHSAQLESKQKPQDNVDVSENNKLWREQWENTQVSKNKNNIDTFIHAINKLGYEDKDILIAINKIHDKQYSESNYNDKLINTQYQMDKIMMFLADNCNRSNYKSDPVVVNNIFVNIGELKNSTETCTLKPDEEGTITIKDCDEHVFSSENLNCSKIKKIKGTNKQLKIRITSSIQDIDIIAENDCIFQVDGNLTLTKGKIWSNGTLIMNIMGNLEIHGGETGFHAIYGGKDSNIYIKCKNFQLNGTGRISTINESNIAYDSNLSKALNNLTKINAKSLYGNVNIIIENQTYISGTIQSGDIKIECNGDMGIEKLEDLPGCFFAMRNNLEIICSNRVSIMEISLWEIIAQKKIKWDYNSIKIIPKKELRCIDTYRVVNIVNSFMKFGFDDVESILSAISNVYGNVYDCSSLYEQIPFLTTDQLTNLIQFLQKYKQEYTNINDEFFKIHKTGKSNMEFWSIKFKNVIEAKSSIIAYSFFKSIRHSISDIFNQSFLPYDIVELCCAFSEIKQYRVENIKWSDHMPSELQFGYFDNFIADTIHYDSGINNICTINVLNDFIADDLWYRSKHLEVIQCDPGIILNVRGKFEMENISLVTNQGKIVLNIDGDMEIYEDIALSANNIYIQCNNFKIGAFQNLNTSKMLVNTSTNMSNIYIQCDNFMMESANIKCDGDCNMYIQCNNFKMINSTIKSFNNHLIINGMSYNSLKNNYNVMSYDSLKNDYNVMCNPNNQTTIYGCVNVNIKKEMVCSNSEIYGGNVNIKCDKTIHFKKSIKSFKLFAFRDDINVKSEIIIVDRDDLLNDVFNARNKTNWTWEQLITTNETETMSDVKIALTVEEKENESKALQAVIGNKFVARNGETITFEERVTGNDLIAIYFSAHWCPQCRKFTTLLKDVYEQWKDKGKKIEVVFVSSDRDDNAFKEYFEQQGDWLSYPFGAEQVKLMKTRYEISGIPTLIVIDNNGKTVDSKARDTVTQNGSDAINKWM